MKPFRFSLQVLRTIREQKEQLALQRYAVALRQAEEAAQRVTAHQAKMSSCWALLQKLLTTGSAFDEVNRVQSYNQFLQERHLELERARHDAEQRAEKAGQEMRVAMRDREALDKFREKQRRAYDLEAQREEQKQLDEMAGRRTGLAEAWPR